MHRIQKSRSLPADDSCCLGRRRRRLDAAVVVQRVVACCKKHPPTPKGFCGARRFLHDLLLSDVCNAESMAETIEDFTVAVRLIIGEPSGSKLLWKAAENWSRFARLVKESAEGSIMFLRNKYVVQKREERLRQPRGERN